MSLLPKNQNGSPYLLLAPMEGVGDRCFRKAMATVGGFNEAVTDFIRVPKTAHVESLAREYQVDEIAPLPLAAQIMGSDTDLMAEMAKELEKKGAPRIDLNCGCPSNTVTGRGAGSSLLKDPTLVYDVAKAMVKAVSIPVSIKMRSGYEDTSLFRENLLAAQESGVCFITLHPRTKVEGYGPPARWDLIAEAKSFLKIPVIGNGDIVKPHHAVQMLKMTGCDALMIGRGSVMNPFIFHQVQAEFSGVPFTPSWNDLINYLNVYLLGLPTDKSPKLKVNKIKQLLGMVFKGNDELLKRRNAILTCDYCDPGSYLDFVIPYLKEGWESVINPT